MLPHCLTEMRLFFTYSGKCVELDPAIKSWWNGLHALIPSTRLCDRTCGTYSTLVASGMSAAAGALSSPMLEQLTTQDAWCSASEQLQLTGQGPQLLPPSPCGPEPHASRQQSATSRLEKKPNLGAQTPCFRLDKVSPFPQGIAHSHRIASDGVSPLSPGRKTKYTQRASAIPRRVSCEETETEEGVQLGDADVSPAFSLKSGRIPFPLKI